jgi:hypothetical protein
MMSGLQICTSGFGSFGFNDTGSVVNQGVVESNGSRTRFVGSFSEGFHLADGNRFSEISQDVMDTPFKQEYSVGGMRWNVLEPRI